ncbi:MAG: hypothetical protein V4850_15480 [Myxococcota bacterium]
MRLPLVFGVALAAALACTGAPEAPPPAAPPPSGPPEAPKAPIPPLSTVGSDADAALADHWLVILGSERDPRTPIPGATKLRESPDAPAAVAARVRQLNSGRFKNLMPCYAITVADTTPDKAAAQALSKRLTELGIDNYVKNAGAWVGPSAAVDTWCGATVHGNGSASAGDPGDESVAVLVADLGQLWLPIEAPETVIGHTLRGAPPPVALSDRYDAWRQPLAIDRMGPISVGSAYRAVDVTTGTTVACTVASFDALTLGFPHFGSLDGEAPTAPTCGEPRVFAALTCDAATPREGTWVAVSGATPLTVYRPAAASPEERGTGLQIAAATTALTASTDWDADPVDIEGEVTRDVRVTRWVGASGELALVEGTRKAGDGVCGGDTQSWAGLFGIDGDTLGAPLGGFVNTPFGDALGIVDARGDGRPELVTRAFPLTTTVTATDGSAVTTLAIDYCDCAC